MRKLIYILSFIPFSCFSQHSAKTDDSVYGGIHFRQGLSWNQIKDKAKAENKFIMVDCFATWCGPCKYMSKQIFPLEVVGNAVNGKFLCVSVQMDSTANDSWDTKKWYKDAHSIEREFQINAYPSFLFFSSEGHIVHKVVGAFNKPMEFLQIIEDAQNPEKQYYTLINHYHEHFGDSIFLHRSLVAALHLNDQVNASIIGDNYLDCLKNPFQRENLQLIEASIVCSKSKGFGLFFHHAVDVDTAMGMNKAEDLVVAIIEKEEIDTVYKMEKPFIDWGKLYKILMAKYPLYADRVLLESKPNYFGFKKMWTEYGRTLVEFMDKYGNKMSNYELNSNAWFMFLYCNERAVLLKALEWSKRSIDNSNPNVNNIDTYACLCYKLNDNVSAIAWETKALGIARNIYEKDNTDTGAKKKIEIYSEIIKKMVRGKEIGDH